MNIQTKQIILKDSLSEPVKMFLSISLNGFGNELNFVANQMYNYPDAKKGIDNKESINDVFALIERSYVGLFNNAIIRGFPNSATLQEFSVYNKNKSSGRADLLVTHALANNEFINLLFEAKVGVATVNDYSADYRKIYYEKLYNQAYKYFLVEKEFYTGESYIITISFDWIRHDYILTEILKDRFIDTVSDFFFVYYTNEAGLSVYGNLSGPVH